MKENKDRKENGIPGRAILCGCAIAALVMSFPVHAEKLQTADANSLTEAIASAQDTNDAELSAKQIQQFENSEELDAEFSHLEEESAMIVEEVERQREEARRSKIWGTVIILLVMGIFGMGVVSTVKDKKAENMGTGLQEKKHRRRDRTKNKSDGIEIEDITD